MKPEDIHAGMWVTSDCPERDKDVPRRVVLLRRSLSCASGWSVDLDGGEPCPCCKRPPAYPQTRIDIGHLHPASPPRSPLAL